MKYTKLFGKTNKEVKRGMQAVSDKFLYQGGFVRQLSAGRYEFLPLGKRVQQKLIKLIEEEMVAIGSQQVSIPVLQPMEFWQKSNRDQAWGKELMKVKDRTETEFALSATGEGIMTEMVAKTNPSYKDLPIIIHQFIIKFRDEKRPRGGLLRVREFIMKDAYSYHLSEKNMLSVYADFRQAYLNIFARLQLPVHVVIADSGALGGDYCHEFQVPCSEGEDLIVKCDKCEYAANTEMAEFKRKAINAKEELKAYAEVDLPIDVCTIPQLMKHYGMPADRFIKNVVYKKQNGQLVIATIRGDLQVNEFKLGKAVKDTDLELATDEDLASIGAKSGYVHSWGYKEYRHQVIFVVDKSIPFTKNLYGGYKTDKTDPINVNYERDFTADMVADIADPFAGAVCVKCDDGKLALIKTAECGHIFKYDHFYSKHHAGYFVDKKGERQLMYMGAYGIGIGRSMAVAVEEHHDDNGIIWPKEIAPFAVHILTLGKQDKTVLDIAQKLYADLQNMGLDVLWDDRDDVSAGVKFADADLIGNPIRVVVSPRALAEQKLEIKLRKEKKSTMIAINDVINYVISMWKNL